MILTARIRVLPLATASFCRRLTMEPLTVTVAGARAVLGLGTTKLYELIGEGKLQTIKVGRRTLVKTDSIRALVDQAA
jgi:excisionase family DNA binding protein